MAAPQALGCVAGQGFLVAESGSLADLCQSPFVAKRKALRTTAAGTRELSPTSRFGALTDAPGAARQHSTHRKLRPVIRTQLVGALGCGLVPFASAIPSRNSRRCASVRQIAGAIAAIVSGDRLSKRAIAVRASSGRPRKP